MRITLTSSTVQEPTLGPWRVMRMSRIMLLVGASALVAAVGGFEAGHDTAGLPRSAAPTSAVEAAQPSPDSVHVAPPALQNMDLHLATVNVQPLVQTVSATGVVAFNDLRMAQLSPPARGRIQSIEVAVGQPVRAGQRLALVDKYDLGETGRHHAPAAGARRPGGYGRATGPPCSILTISPKRAAILPPRRPRSRRPWPRPAQPRLPTSG